MCTTRRTSLLGGAWGGRSSPASSPPKPEAAEFTILHYTIVYYAVLYYTVIYYIIVYYTVV